MQVNATEAFRGISRRHGGCIAEVDCGLIHYSYQITVSNLHPLWADMVLRSITSCMQRSRVEQPIATKPANVTIS